MPPLAVPESQVNERDFDSPTRPQTAPSRRREKPQLSCNLCRRRKSRCDRQQPCSSCVSHGQICSYANGEQQSMYSINRLPGAFNLQDRLTRLESLVMSLKPTSTREANHSPSNPAREHTDGEHLPAQSDSLHDAQSECGSISISPSEHHYIGDDHWAAILNSIAGLKEKLNRDEELQLTDSPDRIRDLYSEEDKIRASHALLLYGCPESISRDGILAALPPRSAVDRYLSRYFNRLDLVSCSIHGPSFLQIYETFWANPSNVSAIWIGLLFSMICLAVMSSDSSDSANDYDAEQQAPQVHLYREKIVQCLVIGEYTNAGPHVLETILHYVYVEFLLRIDADKDLWFLLALEVNFALYMGYHRDPSHFPGISPFHGEMRRRVWATVLLSDSLISSQMGMPRMISDWQCDSTEPRNLNDTDINNNTIQLPVSRPESESTSVSRCISRMRMLLALSKVSNLIAAVKPSGYQDVMEVDTILHRALARISPPLQMRSIEASITDTPQIIMSRIFIRHMFYKGQIMLHRRFIHAAQPQSETTDAVQYSRKACIDASLGLLQIQHTLDEETCPGGQLHTMRWRVTSIMNHQFLTATMILCGLLYRVQTLDREEEIVATLRISRLIWMRRVETSREARKAAETLSVVLSRSRNGQEQETICKPADGVEEEQLFLRDTPPVANESDIDMEFCQGMMSQDPMSFYSKSKFPPRTVAICQCLRL